MAFIKSLNKNRPSLIMHIIYRLGVGGLENGLVNLINHIPKERYRHAIVCLADSTNFRERIQQKDIPVIQLHKRDGKDFGLHIRLLKCVRELQPDIVHTRNLASLEYLIPAALAGVPVRIHGEHGRDIYDLNGSNIKYNLMRKVIKPLIHHHIAVSADLSDWLIRTVGVNPNKLTQIYNGVDLQRFSPRIGPRPSLVTEGFAPPGTLVVGTVGRLEKVKDQLTLVRSFVHLLNIEPSARGNLRLVIVGDGLLREKARQLLEAADVAHLAWIPGERHDIPDVMRGLDLFVLPSLREGISNTILEAMATGLPVIATRVGGNPELVVAGETGLLVPPEKPISMAEAIRSYVINPKQLADHGHAARKRAETYFSIEKMVKGYLVVYDSMLNRQR
jgi:sugar transferase (PEP-CTERM/EpsH1 system associated)